MFSLIDELRLTKKIPTINRNSIQFLEGFSCAFIIIESGKDFPEINIKKRGQK